MSTEEAGKALSRSKIKLMTDSRMAFINTIMFSLKYRWVTNKPTACTDGFTIYINPDFYLGLTNDLRISALLHEVWHVALKHCLKLTCLTLDKERFNGAADYYINLMLKDQGFKIAPDWLCDEQYRGLSAMQIYELLPPTFRLPADLSDIVLSREGTENDHQTDEDLKAHLDNLVTKAYTAARMTGDKAVGHIPGDIMVYLEKLLNPKLPWQVILRRYINSFSKDDYSWKKPNRRYMPQYYLPSLYSESLGEFVEAFDLSGSVTDNVTQQYLTEAYRSFKSVNPKKITLISFDTSIHEITNITNASQILSHKMTGRGGTCIIELMQWAKKHKPAVMVVFTDGEFGFYNVEDPKIPIVWVIHNNTRFNPPFGRVIHHEVEE